MKLKHIVSIVLLGSLIMTACGEYNTTDVKDKNENSEKVYGEKGAPPKQMANKYESDPKNAERVKNIRAKLYPVKK